MGFIQLGFLGALGALLIPILIHLLFRQRSRPMELGTLQFLKVVLRENAQRRRVRRWLLLTLRLACVALAALVFARPYLLATEPGAAERLEVVLIDRSASMSLGGNGAGAGAGGRPIDRAAAEARTILARAGQKTQRELAVFAQGVRPLALDAAGPKRITPSSAGTDYAAAMAWARDVCIRSKRAQRIVHVLTDLQRSGLDRGDPVTMPAGVEVRIVDLGRAFPRNVAVTAVSNAPATIRPGDAATVTAKVVNTSPLPVSHIAVKLHLESNGAAHDSERTIDLDGGASRDVTFDAVPLAEGLWRGQVEAAADDDLPFDNRRYLALSVAPALRVLVVDGDPDRGDGDTPFAAESHFLQAALRLAPHGEKYARSPFDLRVVALGEDGASSLPGLDKTDVVVLANVGALGTSDANQLERLVARGGGLLVFTGDRVDAAAVRPLAALGLDVGTVEGTASVAAAETSWRLERWEANHPLFRPFADPEHGDLRRPAFTAITRIAPDPAAKVLAWFRAGIPAVLERPHGRGNVLWFASACDRDWGDWPRGRMYLPMVHQMIAEAAGLAEGGRVRQEQADDAMDAGIAEAEAAGICRVINVDPFESETARCTPREFADHFGFPLGVPDSAASAGRVGHAPPDNRLRDDEIWPGLALALIGVLLIENFLANRTAA
jgi:hypothetical protein